MAWSESTPVRGLPKPSAGVGRNYLKTAMLMAFLIAVLAIGGQAWGGSGGMLLFGSIGLAINFFSYWFSDRLALMAHRAQPVTREQLPQLYEIVERLTQKAGLPMPKLYVIPSETPNAFATGRNPSHAAVAVTEGIMRILDWRELEGVLAHELSHVKNRDILISTIAAAVAGLISSLGHMIQWGAMFGGLSRRDDEGRGGGLEMLAWAILAPIMAMIIQLAVSRSREYGADASGAALIGDPDPLADALLKLERGNEAIPYQYGGPATAHLFIVQPFSGAGGAIMNLLSTHPPLEERVRRLREMKRGVRYA
ncbi:zinc metalloprotease HtpX [Anaeromyxobacter diazotrophicus]|uniref:Protease HtpX homolog n=1 Tax=Anaeromyxobacter diazotrophicus TaxID=2590199 RepID=A0A7I9VQW6_9BACT|nr:zinc metalloprotease HtpX [Anaeromyxobacter diazotrophicus]GEJ58812.1 protease HtpX [Anaeromyxobacter diazotrophicus]